MMADKDVGTKERLLEAARGLFAVQGFAATSTREIAARAGCNISLISHYFGGKEGLLRAIIVEGAQHVGDELRTLVASPAPVEDKLVRFIDFMVDHFAGHREHMRIVLREVIQGDGRLVDEFLPIITGNIELLRQILEQARAEGRLADVEPRAAAAMLVGSMQSYFAAYPMTSRLIGPATPEVLAQLKRHVAAIFLHGLLR